MTEAEAVWEKRVAAWKASGRPAPEFAQSIGFEASTLRYWASRLRKRAPDPSPALRMVEVVPVPTRRPVVVRVGAAQIEVERGFDPVLLREVVAALEAAK